MTDSSSSRGTSFPLTGIALCIALVIIGALVWKLLNVSPPPPETPVVAPIGPSEEYQKIRTELRDSFVKFEGTMKAFSANLKNAASTPQETGNFADEIKSSLDPILERVNDLVSQAAASGETPRASELEQIQEFKTYLEQFKKWLEEVKASAPGTQPPLPPEAPPGNELIKDFLKAVLPVLSVVFPKLAPVFIAIAAILELSEDEDAEAIAVGSELGTAVRGQSLDSDSLPNMVRNALDGHKRFSSAYDETVAFQDMLNSSLPGESIDQKVDRLLPKDMNLTPQNKLFLQKMIDYLPMESELRDKLNARFQILRY